MAKKTEALATVDGTTGAISTGAFEAALKSGRFSVQRDFKFSEAGQTLHAFFLGAGAPIEVDSQSRPGQKDVIATWRMRDPSGTVIWTVMGSAGLDKQVAALAPETEVLIAFNGTKEIGKGKRMNDFVVAVAK